MKKVENTQKRKKKAYTSPILNKYGLVRDLTTGGSGRLQEGMLGTKPVRFP